MLLLLADDAFRDHVAGPGHPEQPARLAAVAEAFARPELDGAVRRLAPRAATDAELERVHHRAMLDRLGALEGRIGRLDADTGVSERSVELARLAAGAGLAATEALVAGDASAAVCAVRPPGHHATPERSMGFCLINNVAVTAAALAEAGERVLVADFDAHHGNGTQDCFVDDERVLFVSWHQYPLYPGTGHPTERGVGAGEGATVNVAVPAGATGDLYLESLDGVVGQVIDRFAPTWLLVSAGFDAHERDPLTDLALRSGDFGRIVSVLRSAVPSGRTVVFLEGGYDLDALRDSMAATAAALLGEVVHPEAPTSGGPRGDVLDRLATVHGLR